VKIYVVTANYDYEGYAAIKAFRSKRSADAFASSCTKYDTAKPLLDYEQSDVAYDKWCGDFDAWRKLHPAGDNGEADSYFVMELSLVK
jgi:hypothetical protein